MACRCPPVGFAVNSGIDRLARVKPHRQVSGANREERRQRHGDRRDGKGKTCQSRGDQPRRPPQPILTKANSPPGPSSRPVSTATGQDKQNSLPSPISSSDLNAISRDHADKELKRLAHELAEIDVHPNGEEERCRAKVL